MRDPALDVLLVGAIEAPEAQRDAYREPIARHGRAAIIPLLAWVPHPDLALFAVTAIGRTADYGALADARAALRFLLESDVAPSVRDVARAELARLADRPTESARPEASTGRAHVQGVETPPIRSLRRGRVYRRRDLHATGLGGNWQKGISYPARGEHVLLFSGGRGEEEFGYRDHWAGPNEYLYYGEWSGPGDMQLTGGNREIIDRSPNIYLFIARPPDARFEGRFQHIDHDTTQARRGDGVGGSALVFRLRRVADVVDL